MRRLRRQIVRRPFAVAWLLLFAVALRLLVPAGFMPAAQGDALVACPEWGAATIGHHRGAHHGGDGHAPHSHAEPTCPFAGLGLPTLVGDGPLPLAPVAARDRIAPAAMRRDFRLVTAARLRPPPHAPPPLG